LTTESGRWRDSDSGQPEGDAWTALQRAMLRFTPVAGSAASSTTASEFRARCR